MGDLSISGSGGESLHSLGDDRAIQPGRKGIAWIKQNPGKAASRGLQIACSLGTPAGGALLVLANVRRDATARHGRTGLNGQRFSIAHQTMGLLRRVGSAMGRALSHLGAAIRHRMAAPDAARPGPERGASADSTATTSPSHGFDLPSEPTLSSSSLADSSDEVAIAESSSDAARRQESSVSVGTASSSETLSVGDGDEERDLSEYHQLIADAEVGVQRLQEANQSQRGNVRVQQQLREDRAMLPKFTKVGEGVDRHLELELSEPVQKAIGFIISDEDREEVASHLVGLACVESAGVGKAVDRQRLQALLNCPEVKADTELEKAILQEVSSVVSVTARETQANIVWDLLPKQGRRELWQAWKDQAAASPIESLGLGDVITIARQVGIPETAIPNNLTSNHPKVQSSNHQDLIAELKELEQMYLELGMTPHASCQGIRETLGAAYRSMPASNAELKGLRRQIARSLEGVPGATRRGDRVRRAFGRSSAESARKMIARLRSQLEEQPGRWWEREALKQLDGLEDIILYSELSTEEVDIAELNAFAQEVSRISGENSDAVFTHVQNVNDGVDIILNEAGCNLALIDTIKQRLQENPTAQATEVATEAEKEELKEIFDLLEKLLDPGSQEGIEFRELMVEERGKALDAMVKANEKLRADLANLLGLEADASPEKVQTALAKRRAELKKRADARVTTLKEQGCRVTGNDFGVAALNNARRQLAPLDGVLRDAQVAIETEERLLEQGGFSIEDAEPFYRDADGNILRDEHGNRQVAPDVFVPAHAALNRLRMHRDNIRGLLGIDMNAQG